MKATYLSEGRIDEIDIPCGFVIEGDYTVAHRVFTYTGDGILRDILDVYKGETRLFGVFYHDHAKEPCVRKYDLKNCWRLQTLYLAAQVVMNWNNLIDRIEEGASMRIPEEDVVKMMKGGNDMKNPEGTAYALMKKNKELRVENNRLRARLAEHDGCSRWGIRDVIAMKKGDEK